MLMRSDFSRSPRRAAVHHWPAAGRADGLSEEQAQAAMRAFLHATGWDAGDFELRTVTSPVLGRPMRPKDRLVRVTRRATGSERLYCAGPFSAWLAQLLDDVEQGCFGTTPNGRSR